MTQSSDSNAGQSMTEKDDAWDLAIREAIDWTILFDDDPDDADLRARFAQWLAADPLHERAWAEASHVSGLIVQTKSVTLFPSGFPSGAAPNAETKPAKARFRPRARAFAAVAAAAMLAWVAGPQLMLRASADYHAGTAQERMIVLDDGSTVRLAPGSALKVAYAEGRRNVVLLSGEAFFEVTHDAAHPFSVTAKSTKVTVLGTGFNVRLGDTAEDVAVRHGRVRIENPDGQPPVSSVLTEGQWARLSWNGSAVRGEVSPELVGAWSGSRIMAVDKPLSEVIADLRRYYSGTIILTGDALARKSVTGIYDVRDPAAAARIIVQPHGGNVHQITPWLMIISSS